MSRSRKRAIALLAWFDTTARRLPWRGGDPDPWHVLVSEVMLQQTPVRRVEPHYGPFLAEFPDPAAFAAATSADVVRAWGGLGYLRRAFRLQEAARRIVADGWPTTPEALRTLPGVGPYTAAAVACFAFGHPVPTVDTNLRRVLSRWEGRVLRPGEAAAVAAAELVPEKAAAWNQAVMDLGSAMCRPRSPLCGECPVRAWCSDPSVYEPPPRQAPFEGSVRQVRAAILRHLAAHGDADAADLPARVRANESLVAGALASLVADGLVTTGERVQLR